MNHKSHTNKSNTNRAILNWDKTKHIKERCWCSQGGRIDGGSRTDTQTHSLIANKSAAKSALVSLRCRLIGRAAQTRRRRPGPGVNCTTHKRRASRERLVIYAATITHRITAAFYLARICGARARACENYFRPHGGTIVYADLCGRRGQKVLDELTRKRIIRASEWALSELRHQLTLLHSFTEFLCTRPVSGSSGADRSQDEQRTCQQFVRAAA